jgi:aminoglycoside phosphotransferase (APT) family kinase protein
VPSRSPFALAALADAAVHELAPVSVRPDPGAVDDLDVAVVQDAGRRSWVVRAPRTPVAATRLEREVRVLSEIRGCLPFVVPEIAGTAPLPAGGRAFVHPRIPGEPLRLDAVSADGALALSLGRAIAGIHCLEPRLVEDADAPVYGPEDLRERHLAELDRAAATGSVPVPLLSRWEKALEEAGAWRFVPCCVHGDLAAENVLVDGDEVTGILDWGEAHVADPADDLGWLAIGAEAEVMTRVIEAYATARREPPDPNLARRARFVGEIAMVRWLLHGVATDDATVVDDAVHMLTDLEVTVADRPW